MTTDSGTSTQGSVEGAPPGKMRRGLSRGGVASYAMGDVANNLTFQMTSMFLMVYMTDIAGISAGVAGTIYAVTKVWAGVSDLIAGSTVDKANTRWGRLRPWLLWISTPLAVVFVLLFSVPAGLSPVATIAWIFLLDAAFQLAYSFINIPYGSLSAAMTQNSVDRSRLSGARSIASAVTGVALSAVISPQFENTGSDGIRLQFTIITGLLGLLAVVLYLICFRNTREVVPRPTGKINMRRTLSMVRRNRPLLVLCVGAFFLFGAMFTMNSVSVYYAREIVGNASSLTLLMLAQTVGTIIAASLVAMISEKMGKRGGYVMMAFLAVTGYLIAFFVPSGEGALFVAVVAWFLLGLGFGGTNALMFSMQADTVDYGEWKTGIRAEGGSYSILSFVRKCGQGLGGAIGGSVIAAFGYVAGAAAQPEQAAFGIRVATGAIPALLGVVAALVLLAYPLTTRKHEELVGELSERRTRGAITGDGDAAAVTVPSVGDRRVTTLGGEGTQAPVVTIFEHYGSGGTVIGPKVAELLGVPFMGQAFSSDEVAQMNLESLRSGGALSRWMRNVDYAGTTDADLARAAGVSSDHRMVIDNTRQVIDAVRDGGVVLGHNGQAILARTVGALHVRLTAPQEMRTQRVMYLTGTDDPAAALRRQEHEDQVRAEMSKRLHRLDPHDDDHYDLVINTGTFTFEQVAQLIVEVYRSKYPQAGPDQGGDAAVDPNVSLTGEMRVLTAGEAEDYVARPPWEGEEPG